MKVNKKKALALIVAASMAFTGSACGVSKKENSLKIKAQNEYEIAGTTYYWCNEEEIIKEIINQITYVSKEGRTMINFESVFNYDSDGIVCITEEFMGIGYDTDNDAYADEIYLTDTNYERIVDNIFRLDKAEVINILPIYSAMKLENGNYNLVLSGLNESQTGIYDGKGNLYEEDGFYYYMSQGLIFGSAELTEDEAKKLFIKYLKIYMNNPFGFYVETEITKTENNDTKLLLVKKESEAI